MAIHTIARVGTQFPMFAFELESPKMPDIAMPERDVWAVLNRDGLRDYVINHGFVGMTMDLRRPKGTPPGTNFLVCFGRARREETVEPHPLIADMLKGTSGV